MIEPIVDAIRGLTHTTGPSILVALDGRSGTGKSTLALALAQELPATVVSSDDFFAAEMGLKVQMLAEQPIARDGGDTVCDFGAISMEPALQQPWSLGG